MFEHLKKIFEKYLYRFAHLIFIFRQWILDAIPVIGTPAALRFIKEKFLAGELTVAETAQALIASIHMVTASTEAIKLVKVGKPQCKLICQ